MKGLDRGYFTLETEMSVSESLSKLRWLPYQVSSSAANRYNRVYSKEIDDEKKSFHLIIADIIFSKSHAEAIGHLENSNGTTLIQVEIKNITRNTSTKGIIFLVLFLFCMLLYSILNIAYAIIFLLFICFSIIVYIYSIFVYRWMLLNTIKQNLNAKQALVTKDKSIIQNR